jgi:hypothetical protein
MVEEGEWLAFSPSTYFAKVFTRKPGPPRRADPKGSEMLSVTPELGYARLQIPPDQDFSQVAEAIRTLFHVCCLNDHLGALIVSEQTALDWRTCMRLGIRVASTKEALPKGRLALVIGPGHEKLHRDVCDVADEAGIPCQVFPDESEAIAWLRSKG